MGSLLTTEQKISFTAPNHCTAFSVLIVSEIYKSTEEETNVELSKNDTKMLQGLSVLAMIWLHLFCKDYTGLFTPIIFVRGYPLSFYIAQLCDFCVFGFAFCSGYAHMVQYGKIMVL